MSITDEDGFIQITIPPGAYEIKNLKNEIKRINIDGGFFTETVYPFTIQPKFSTFGNIIETPSQGPLNCFLPHDSMRSFRF